MCNSEYFELPRMYVKTIVGVLLRDLIDELYKFPKIIEESSQTTFMFSNFISIST